MKSTNKLEPSSLSLLLLKASVPLSLHTSQDSVISPSRLSSGTPQDNRDGLALRWLRWWRYRAAVFGLRLSSGLRGSAPLTRRSTGKPAASLRSLTPGKVASSCCCFGGLFCACTCHLLPVVGFLCIKVPNPPQDFVLFLLLFLLLPLLHLLY